MGKVSRKNADKTHCPQGHAYDEANTIVQSTGSRLCRECKNAAQRARSARMREEQRLGLRPPRRRPEREGRPKRLPLEERLLQKVDRDGPDGCWVWLASIDRHGYGRFGMGADRVVLAHRASYEIFVGPIPEGLQLDHLCRNTACVNPRHLDPVTPRVNVHRSGSIPAMNARKTHCINGHEFTPENTYRSKLGRACKACQAARREAAKAAKQRP